MRFAFLAAGSLDGLPPVLGRARILPPILEEVGQARNRLPFEHRSRLGSRVLDDLLKQLDKVVLIWKLESLDSSREPSDRFIFAERIQRPDAGFVFVLFGVRLDRLRQLNAKLGERLHIELRLQKLSAN